MRWPWLALVAACSFANRQASEQQEVEWAPVRGRLLALDGTPVPDTSIGVWSGDEVEPSGIVRTDSDGTFGLAVPVGQVVSVGLLDDDGRITAPTRGLLSKPLPETTLVIAERCPIEVHVALAPELVAAIPFGRVTLFGRLSVPGIAPVTYRATHGVDERGVSSFPDAVCTDVMIASTKIRRVPHGWLRDPRGDRPFLVGEDAPIVTDAALQGFRDHPGRIDGFTDPNLLNNVAWELLTDDRHARRWDDVAIQAAERSNTLTAESSWAYVDTLALARFRAGRVREAVMLQKKALQLARNDAEDQATLDELASRLSEFNDAAR